MEHFETSLLRKSLHLLKEIALMKAKIKGNGKCEPVSERIPIARTQSRQQTDAELICASQLDVCLTFQNIFHLTLSRFHIMFVSLKCLPNVKWYGGTHSRAQTRTFFHVLAVLSQIYCHII